MQRSGFQRSCLYIPIKMLDSGNSSVAIPLRSCVGGLWFEALIVLLFLFDFSNSKLILRIVLLFLFDFFLTAHYFCALNTMLLHTYTMLQIKIIYVPTYTYNATTTTTTIHPTTHHYYTLPLHTTTHPTTHPTTPYYYTVYILSSLSRLLAPRLGRRWCLAELEAVGVAWESTSPALPPLAPTNIAWPVLQYK